MSDGANGDFNWTPFEEAPRVAARAWEARPYQVAVWICHPGLPELVAVEDRIIEDIEAACELKDASSWFVNVGTPTGPTRNFLFSSVQNAEPGGEFEKDPMLKFYDKLMVVRLERVAGATAVVVREYDLQTGQWGPIVEKTSTNIASLGGVVESRKPLCLWLGSIASMLIIKFISNRERLKLAFVSIGRMKSRPRSFR